MRLIVKEYQFSDMLGPVGITSTITPPDPENFAIEVNIAVGWEGREGADRYYIYVYSPSALLTDQLWEGEIFDCRHSLLMQRYDEEKLKIYIESFIESLTDLPKAQQNEHLTRLGQWEFEDYTDYNEKMIHEARMVGIPVEEQDTDSRIIDQIIGIQTEE